MEKEINNKMFSWMNDDLEVRSVSGYGKGVFVKKDIKKGELLAIFGGYILTLEEEAQLPEEFKDGGLQISKNHVICSMNHSESTDFFNHSCNPNAGFSGQISLIAIVDIKKDDQITFDYATCLYSESVEDYYSFKCECGDSQCRGNVTSNDWKNKELQDKYRGYFQKYLEAEI
jgi:SET domain-containing protein